MPADVVDLPQFADSLSFQQQRDLTQGADALETTEVCRINQNGTGTTSQNCLRSMPVAERPIDDADVGRLTQPLTRKQSMVAEN